MRTIKSLLLGAATGLVAVAGAQAADLPVKAKAVEYVKICSAYGAGFYYIPGTDICLRVGGYLRADYYVHSAQGTGYAPIYTQHIGDNGVWDRDDQRYGTRGRGAIILDARTNTSYGTLRSYAAFNVSSTPTGTGAGIGESLDAAYIQFAGFTFGFTRSFYDFSGGYFFANHVGHSNIVGVNVLAYTAQLGNGLSATLSLEDTSARKSAIVTGAATGLATANTANQSGNYMPDIVGNLRVSQAWGSAQIMASVNKIRTSGALVSTASDTWGYGLGAGIEVKTNATDSWFLTGSYAKGNLGTVYALVFSPPTGIAHRDSAVAPFGGPHADLFNAFNTGTSLEKSRAWGVAGAYRHFWQPNLRSAIGAGYASFEPGAAASLANYSGIDVWQISGQTIWSPVSGLDLGVEVTYSNLDGTCGTAACSLRGDDGSSSVWSGMFRAQRNF